MSDCSTPTGPTLDLITGHCWAQSELPGRLMDISVISKHMESLTLVRMIFTLAAPVIPDPNGRLLHNSFAEPRSDRGRLEGSMPASQ